LKLLQKGDSPEKALEAFSVALTNKFLHAPSHALNNTHGDEHAKLEEILKDLYQIKS
jgi:glutamyl-tRNA reductase